jgi:hypothetical protein
LYLRGCGSFRCDDNLRILEGHWAGTNRTRTGGQPRLEGSAGKRQPPAGLSLGPEDEPADRRSRLNGPSAFETRRYVTL